MYYHVFSEIDNSVFASVAWLHRAVGTFGCFFFFLLIYYVCVPQALSRYDIKKSNFVFQQSARLHQGLEWLNVLCRKLKRKLLSLLCQPLHTRSDNANKQYTQDHVVTAVLLIILSHVVYTHIFSSKSNDQNCGCTIRWLSDTSSWNKLD